MLKIIRKKFKLYKYFYMLTIILFFYCGDIKYMEMIHIKSLNIELSICLKLHSARPERHYCYHFIFVLYLIKIE